MISTEGSIKNLSIPWSEHKYPIRVYKMSVEEDLRE